MASEGIIRDSIRDVLLSHREISPKIIATTKSYYDKSKGHLGALSSTEEHERVHLCAILAVEKYRRELNLPQPSTNKIALPPAKIKKLKDQLQNVLFSLSPSPKKSSPVSAKSRNGPFGAMPISPKLTSTPAVPTPSPRASPRRTDPHNSMKESLLDRAFGRNLKEKKNGTAIPITTPDKTVSSSAMESQHSLVNGSAKKAEPSIMDTPSSSAKKNKIASSKRALDDDEVSFGDLKGYYEHHQIDDTNFSKKGVANLKDKMFALSPKPDTQAPTGNGALISTPSRKRTATLLGSVKAKQQSPAESENEDIINISSAEPSPAAKKRTLRHVNRPNYNENKKSSRAPVGNLSLKLRPQLANENQDPDLDFQTSLKINRHKAHRYSPKKSSPLKTLPLSGYMNGSNDYNNDEIPSTEKDKHVTSADIVDICNMLKIPTPIAHKLLATFLTYRSKIKEEWGFICGLIMMVYYRIFSSKFSKKVGLRGEFHNQLFNWQRGELTFEGMKHWNLLTEGMVIESESWIKDLEIKYDYQGRGNNVIDNTVRFLYSTGDMLNPAVDYLNKLYCAKYDDWIQRVKADILAMK